MNMFDFLGNTGQPIQELLMAQNQVAPQNQMPQIQSVPPNGTPSEMRTPAGSAQGVAPGTVGSTKNPSSILGSISSWLGKPPNQQALLQMGGVIGGKGSLAERAAQAYGPTLKGKIAQQHLDKRTQQQMQLSKMLADPNLAGLTFKQGKDGELVYSLKATPQTELAKAEAMNRQLSAGAEGQTSVGTQVSSKSEQATPEAYVASAYGTDRPAGEQYAKLPQSWFMGATDPSNSSSGASSEGLSPEELLAVEAGARSNAGQPFNNALNQAQMSHMLQQTQDAGRKIAWPVDSPEGGRTVMQLTPKEWIDYQGHLMSAQNAKTRFEETQAYRDAMREELRPGREAGTRNVDLEAKAKQQKQEVLDSLEDRFKGWPLEELQKRGLLTAREQSVLGIDKTVLGQGGKEETSEQKNRTARLNSIKTRHNKKIDYYTKDPMGMAEAKAAKKSGLSMAFESMMAELSPEDKALLLEEFKPGDSAPANTGVRGVWNPKTGRVEW